MRSFGAQERFINKSNALINRLHQTQFARLTAQLLMDVNLQLIGAISIGIVIAFIVIDDSISPGIAALCLSYSINLVEEGKTLALLSTDYEAGLNSVERLIEFRDLPQEAPYVIENVCPPDWPTVGRVMIDNLSLRYREGLDLVLKGISLEFEPGEKV